MPPSAQVGVENESDGTALDVFGAQMSGTRDLLPEVEPSEEFQEHASGFELCENNLHGKYTCNN